MITFGNYFKDDIRRSCLESAVAAGDWIVNNQVQDFSDQGTGSHPYQMNLKDANRGRVMGLYGENPDTKLLGINWHQGIAIAALLALYWRTGKKRYLESAVMAGEYVKTLQINSAIFPEINGIIQEQTGQSRWTFPRDGATAAYGMLCLYNETDDKEYLRMARANFDWALLYPWTSDGWINYKIDLNQRNMDIKRFNFQAGIGFFMSAAYHCCGAEYYLGRGLKPLCDGYIDNFLQKDGSHLVLLEAEGNFEGNRHMYNDDFIGISLLAAYRQYGNKKYLEAVERFLNWMADVQNEDGSFGKKQIFTCANSTIVNLSADYCHVTGKVIHSESVQASIDYLKRIQFQSDNPKWNGGIPGEWDHPAPAVHIRSVAYAVIAMLKMEGHCDYPFFSSIPLYKKYD